MGQEGNTLHVRDHAVDGGELDVARQQIHAQHTTRRVENPEQRHHAKLVPAEREHLLATIHHQLVVVPVNRFDTEIRFRRTPPTLARSLWGVARAATWSVASTATRRAGGTALLRLGNLTAHEGAKRQWELHAAEGEGGGACSELEVDRRTRRLAGAWRAWGCRLWRSGLWRRLW